MCLTRTIKLRTTPFVWIPFTVSEATIPTKNGSSPAPSQFRPAHGDRILVIFSQLKALVHQYRPFSQSFSGYLQIHHGCKCDVLKKKNKQTPL